MVDSKKDTDKRNECMFEAIIDDMPVIKAVASATTCPRCSAKFVCNAANIEQCQCWGVELGSRELEYLKSQGVSEQYVGCLCRSCLLEIQKDVALL